MQWISGNRHRISRSRHAQDDLAPVSVMGPASRVVVHQQKTLFVRDLPSHGRAVAIHLDVPRLKCHDCVRTFTAVVPEVDADRQMTERLVEMDRAAIANTPLPRSPSRSALMEDRSSHFRGVRCRTGKQYQRDTPVILGLDEIYLSRPRASSPTLATAAWSTCWRTGTRRPSLNSCAACPIRN